MIYSVTQKSNTRTHTHTPAHTQLSLARARALSLRMIEILEIFAVTWEDEGGSKVCTKEAKDAGDQGRSMPCLQHVHGLLAALKSDIQNEGVKVARD